MKVISCLAASNVIRDADSGNVSAIGILEELGSVGFPFLVQEAGVLAIWELEKTDKKDITDVVFRVRNNKHLLFNAPIVIKVGTRLHRSLIRLQGLMIREPGSLAFEFVRQNKVVASYEVLVKPPVVKQVSASAG